MTFPISKTSTPFHFAPAAQIQKETTSTPTSGPWDASLEVVALDPPST